MPQKKPSSWTDYAKRMAAGSLSLASAYALSAKNPKAKKTSEPKKKKEKTLGQRAAGGLMRSKARYEQAARMSRGEAAKPAAKPKAKPKKKPKTIRFYN